MEISYDFSHFYSGFLQEMDNHNNGNVISSGGGNNNNISSNNKKRKGNGDGGGGTEKKSSNNNNNNNNAVKEILSSLLLLDEEAKFETEKWVSDREQDKAMFDENYEQKSKAMKEYYEKFQEHHSDLNEVDQLRIKRARKSASGIVVSAVAAAAAADTVSSDNSAAQSGGGGGAATSQQHRRLWVKDRSKAWWEWCNHPDFPEAEFKKSFRMSRATFDMICEKLDSAVTKKNTMLRDAIPVRQRVAVCVWRLATGEPLRLVSKRFGLGISTCHKLVLEVCQAIKTVLMPMFLKWPNEENLKKIKDEFETMSRIPNVAGSMYTTHIPIIAPKVGVQSYFNRRHTERNQKTSYSITVQGVVDPKGVFTDISIGWPGSLPDEQVLEKSSLYQSAANKGHMKNVWIVGNSGHPLMDWVLVPYTHQNLTWTQHTFNEKMGDVQSVAKDAFARLKGRWACLQKRTEVKLQDLPGVLGACCVLHNICEMNGEEMEPELGFELFDDEMVPENGVRSMSAVQARDHIAHNLLHHHGLAAGTSFL